MSVSAFYMRGRRAALENVRHGTCGYSRSECPGCWSDVPAILTATYSEAPEKEEMREYGRGYFDVIDNRVVASDEAIEAEKRRLSDFIEAGGRSACEIRWFGGRRPDEDRGKRGIRRYVV